jgi:hypothetical protein
MEVVKNLFKTPTTTKTSDANIGKILDPVKSIEEQIKFLENINLSPLPNSKEAVRIQKSDVSTSLKKIIFNFDVILMDKLRRNSSEKNLLKQASSGTPELEVHYWNYLSKFFQIPSVKFINNYCNKLQTNAEKGLAWLCISITEKSLTESIKEIYNQSFDKKFYEQDALICTRKEEIIKYVDKLTKFHLFNIKLGIEDEYNEYKRMKETEGKEEEGNDIDLPSVSPISKKINDKYFYITPYLLTPKDNNANRNPINFLGFNNNAHDKNPFYYSRGDNPLHSKADNNFAEKEKSTRTIDNLFNLINNEEEDIIELQNNDDGEEEEIEQIKEQSYAKNTHIIYNNVNQQQRKRSSEKITALKKLEQNSVNENYNVSKYIDFNSVYKDDHFNFIQPYNKVVNDSISLNNFTITTTTNKELREGSQNIQSTSNTPVMNSPQKYAGDSNNPNLSSFIPFDKKFRICRKVDKNHFTKKDIIYYKNKELKLTNSVVFYLNNFYKKEAYIRFNTQIASKKPTTLASQNYQCQFCRKKFPTFLSIPLSKVYWCSYYMRFICSECTSEEYSIIPAFILKNWDFKKYQISKDARDLLASWYEKPVVHVKQNDHIIKKSTLLHQAILLKRKIHKIYDLMKCDHLENFVISVLGHSYKHLVLREILFSLKDLVDIYEYRMLSKLKEYLRKFEDHILKDCTVKYYFLM